MSNTIAQIISERYDELTPSMRRVADYLLACHSEAQYLSITELASECGVGKATVSCLCQAVGVEGCKQPKIVLSLAGASDPAGMSTVSMPQGEVSIEAMASELLVINLSAMRQTLSLLDWDAVSRTVDLLLSADEVCCMGQGGGLVLAMDAWSRFMTVSRKFRCVEDTHLQIMTASLLGKNSTVLFISYSGATTDAVDIIRPAARSGAKVVLVTRHANSPTAALCDEVLVCGGREGPLEAGSISVKMAMLLVVDVLFNEYCRRDAAGTTAARDLTSEALSSHLL